MTDDTQVPAKVEKAAIRSGAALQAFIPETLEDAWRMAEALASQGGDMVPDCYRGKPGAIMLAMQKGAELGLAPLAAIQTIAAINGRATLWGDAIPGLIWKAGHKIEEWIEGEGDDMVAHCRLTRRGGLRVERTFSAEDAKRAGLWQTEATVTRRKRDGQGTYEKENDSPWYRYPKRMLAMRARSFAVRDGAADVTMGLSVREEVDDFPPRGPDHAKDVTPESESLKARIARARSESAPGEQAKSEPDDAETVEEITPEKEAEITADIRRQHEKAMAEESGDLFDSSDDAP